MGQKKFLLFLQITRFKIRFKIYGKHTFKLGFEAQHVKFSTLQPPWSRGQFNFDGTYTDVPNVGGGNTGRAQFLLTPTAATGRRRRHVPGFHDGQCRRLSCVGAARDRHEGAERAGTG